MAPYRVAPTRCPCLIPIGTTSWNSSCPTCGKIEYQTNCVSPRPSCLLTTDHTILYLRFYPIFMPLPGLSWLVGKLGSLMNLVIAHQDRRIVNTQLPKSDGIGTGENLFRGDKPIMEFRKKRQELMRSR